MALTESTPVPVASRRANFGQSVEELVKPSSCHAMQLALIRRVRAAPMHPRRTTSAPRAVAVSA